MQEQEPLLPEGPSSFAAASTAHAPSSSSPLSSTPATRDGPSPARQLQPLTDAQKLRRRKVLKDGSLGEKMQLLTSRRRRFKAVQGPPEKGVMIGFAFIVVSLILFYVFVLPKPPT